MSAVKQVDPASGEACRHRHGFGFWPAHVTAAVFACVSGMSCGFLAGSCAVQRCARFGVNGKKGVKRENALQVAFCYVLDGGDLGWGGSATHPMILTPAEWAFLLLLSPESNSKVMIDMTVLEQAYVM